MIALYIYLAVCLGYGVWRKSLLAVVVFTPLLVLSILLGIVAFLDNLDRRRRDV